jgi:hypothetical protein
MYLEFSPDDPLNQGDIIKDVVFSYTPDISDPELYGGENRLNLNLSEPFPNAGVSVLGAAFKSPAMIVSQGCDIDYKKYICVARIVPFNDVNYMQATTPQTKAEYIKSHYQKVGIRPHLYYLQEALEGQFPKSVVSFLEMHSIKKSANTMEYLMRNRILRLIPNAVGDLQFRLSFFFGRFAGTIDNYMLTDAEKQLTPS